MKKKIAEETILFVSLITWVLLASVMGVLTGLSNQIGRLERDDFGSM